MATRQIEVSDLVIAIEERITELGITDAEGARRIGISPQRLSQWKRGASINLDGGLQRDAAKFLGVAPRRVLELMGYDLGSRALGGYSDRRRIAA